MKTVKDGCSRMKQVKSQLILHISSKYGTRYVIDMKSHEMRHKLDPEYDKGKAIIKKWVAEHKEH